MYDPISLSLNFSCIPNLWIFFKEETFKEIYLLYYSVIIYFKCRHKTLVDLVLTYYADWLLELSRSFRVLHQVLELFFCLLLASKVVVNIFSRRELHMGHVNRCLKVIIVSEFNNWKTCPHWLHRSNGIVRVIHPRFRIILFRIILSGRSSVCGRTVALSWTWCLILPFFFLPTYYDLWTWRWI